MLWVTVAFCIAVAVALAALFALGAVWVGDELRAAAPHDPMLRHGAAPVYGIVLFPHSPRSRRCSPSSPVRC